MNGQVPKRRSTTKLASQTGAIRAFSRLLCAATLLACAPRQDGLTPLPFGETVDLAFGDQRLLVPLDRRQSYQLTLTPEPGDFAALSASLCALDVHQRVDEGDSHCVAQEVTVGAAGASAVRIPAGDPRFGHLALRLFAEGPSRAPVRLRIDARPADH